MENRLTGSGHGIAAARMDAKLQEFWEIVVYPDFDDLFNLYMKCNHVVDLGSSSSQIQAKSLMVLLFMWS
ncbi:hypothetical protein ACS0TY_029671 [Phlomoides rotata]